MKIGLLKNTYSADATESEKIKVLGMNTGNLVFWESIKRLFQPEIIPYSFEKQNISLNNYDKIIITDLIWINENAKYEYLEKYIDKYAVDFVPLSVGLQSKDMKNDFLLSAETVRLLKKIEERANIAVRGYYTADILNKYGIKNTMVVGCPSMYYWNNPYLQIYDRKDKVKYLSSNFRTFYGRLSNEEKHFLTYCANENAQFIEQTLHPFSLESAGNDKAFYAYINKWIWKEKIIPCSTDEWRDCLRRMDFSMGCRFHGNVIALWNNIKSLFITVDSRTKELTDYFNLPAIDIKDFDKDVRLDRYYEMADYSEFNKNYYSKFLKFLEFLDSNEMKINIHTSVKQFNPEGNS